MAGLEWLPRDDLWQEGANGRLLGAIGAIGGYWGLLLVARRWLVEGKLAVIAVGWEGGGGRGREGELWKERDKKVEGQQAEGPPTLTPLLFPSPTQPSSLATSTPPLHHLYTTSTYILPTTFQANL